jgi:hypothetical protein
MVTEGYRKGVYDRVTKGTSRQNGVRPGEQRFLLSFSQVAFHR